MLIRRKLYLVWLALTLNALAPVLAYAHIHVGAHGEIIEHCVADEPGDADTDAQDEHSHHSPSGKGTVPHCPYCAGFAAGVALAYSGLGPTFHGDASALPVPSLYAEPSGRSSVRIAQQRAPPASS
jgi:Protein of unknown function (DUF2946)